MLLCFNRLSALPLTPITLGRCKGEGVLSYPKQRLNYSTINFNLFIR